MQKAFATALFTIVALEKLIWLMDVMLLFALMEVNLICQQHQHKQAGSPFWSSKKDQTDPEEEKPNTAT